VIEKHGISSEQIDDGQYFHLSVNSQVQDHFQLKSSDIHDDWDGMHKCGLGDKAVRKIATHAWLIAVTQIISEVFGLVNWGKIYEELKNACDKLDQEMSNPLTWSNTKFANYAHRVYLAMVKDFPAILEVLTKIQKDRNKDSKAKERADNAEQIEKKISNKKFAVRLYGVKDIHKVFGQMVGVLQSFNSLPFQRYDKFQTPMGVLEKMSEKKLYVGVEMILQAIAVSSIKISVESIAESFISEYNRRNDKLRTLSEDAAEFEMEISKNGPVIAECVVVVAWGLFPIFAAAIP
jgi:hypothetical protein